MTINDFMKSCPKGQYMIRFYIDAHKFETITFFENEIEEFRETLENILQMFSNWKDFQCEISRLEKYRLIKEGDMTVKSISCTNIDDTIFSIEKKMWKKCGIDTSVCIAPLKWYINTGRASTGFLSLFVNTTERQKTTIANRLIKNGRGSYEAAIDSICHYLGYRRE